MHTYIYIYVWDFSSYFNYCFSWLLQREKKRGGVLSMVTKNEPFLSCKGLTRCGSIDPLDYLGSSKVNWVGKRYWGWVILDLLSFIIICNEKPYRSHELSKHHTRWRDVSRIHGPSGLRSLSLRRFFINIIATPRILQKKEEGNFEKYVGSPPWGVFLSHCSNLLCREFMPIA